jgi:hypothetical protein
MRRDDSIVWLGLSLLSSVSLILSIFANSRCNLFKFDNNTPLSSILLRRLPSAPRAIGLWCMETTEGTLISLRNSSIGGVFGTARALGTATLLLGTIIVIFLSASKCFRFTPNTIRFIGGLCIGNGLLQGLVFIAHKSVRCIGSCRLDTGGRCAVAAIIMWIITGVVTFWAVNNADEVDNNTDKSKPKSDLAAHIENRAEPIDP